jgi:hypothetical protein
MAKNSIRDFDATSSNNTDIQSVNIAEGCSPAGINNAIRELMADIKDVSAGTIALESPSADSMTVTGGLRVDNEIAINTTAKTWDASTDAVQFQSGSLWNFSTSQLNLDQNVYYNGAYKYLNAGAASEYSQASGAHFFKVASTGSADADITFSTALTVANSGNVGIGETSPSSYYSKDLVVKCGSSESGITIRSNATTDTNYLMFADGTSGDAAYRGYIGYTHNSPENMQVVSSGYTRFYTGDPRTERMRIDSSGDVLMHMTTSSSSNVGHLFANGGAAFHMRSGGVPLVVDRFTDDGNLVLFRQANTDEGTISVSGTTVSYNGGHLSRWSQLTDSTKDTSIVKGTVMTNLDQMAVWSHDAVAATYYTDDDELPEGVSVGDEKTPAVDAFTEDNEQLNCMAVSSVEGDTNVAGVFVNWDYDDDQFNDMNVAMTGDMVIRIASGTTVARGDLLMSAGDGTAKPQGDDIVRSKTIAKVTSTHVSHTYDDNSYLVPVVLMAC